MPASKDEAMSSVHGVPAKSPAPPLRIAIAGMGAIGTAVARAIVQGAIPGATLVAVSARDQQKCRATVDALGSRAPVLPLADLSRDADIVLECAPAAFLDDIVRPVVVVGKTAVVLSVGALLSHFDLVEVARQNGGQIIVPTGALLGLDAVCAAAQGTIHSVTMTTRKPISSLIGAPYLVENKIDIADIKEPLRIFKGSARKAAVGFPANLNVAAALSLAGIGPDRTILEVWADPSVTRNTHHIVVDADSARLDMTIANVPSENPRTGRITALSVVAALKKLYAPLRVGT
jgi:aspartate dehydrogenase